MWSRLTGDRQAGPKSAACMPPAIQIATTTSAMVPNPTASPCRKVFSGDGPVSPILASERPSTKRTQPSTAASVGAKPIHSSAYKPARPIGSPLGVDQCCDCIHPSSAITGTALNRIIRIGVSQAQGSQPRAGSGEYRATGVMRAPGRRDRRCKLPSARGRGNRFATKQQKPPLNHSDRRRNG